MKRLKALFFSVLLAAGLASCNQPFNEPSQEETITEYHFVSFYVDDVLYKTARIKDGESVTNIIDEPSKADYTFAGWKTKDGKELSLETSIITADLRVDAVFEKKVVNNPVVGNLNVEDVKDPTKDYYLVVGWYGKTETTGVDVTVMTVFYQNLISYLKSINVSESDIAKISVRRYGDAQTDVAGMSSLVIADGDVDILVGVGNKIGELVAIDKVTDIAMGEKTGRQVISLTTDTPIVQTILDFLEASNVQNNSMFLDTFEISKTVINTPGDDPDTFEYNVEDIKDPSKEYYLVIGWYGKTGTSGVDAALMQIFAKNLFVYLKSIGVSDDDIAKISIRRYGGADTNVQGMSDLVVADGDVDILVGVGNKIGDLTALRKVEGITMGAKDGRQVISLTDSKEIITQILDYIEANHTTNSMFSDSFVL